MECTFTATELVVCEKTESGPDWLAITLVVVAVAVGAITWWWSHRQLQNYRKREMEHREREQAALIYVFADGFKYSYTIDGDTSIRIDAIVRNPSPTPIYHCVISLLDWDWNETTDSAIKNRTRMIVLPESNDPIDFGTIQPPPGGVAEHGTATPPPFDLVFTDAVGATWRRFPNGTLRRWSHKKAPKWSA